MKQVLESNLAECDEAKAENIKLKESNEDKDRTIAALGKSNDYKDRTIAALERQLEAKRKEEEAKRATDEAKRAADEANTFCYRLFQINADKSLSPEEKEAKFAALKSEGEESGILSPPPKNLKNNPKSTF